MPMENYENKFDLFSLWEVESQYSLMRIGSKLESTSFIYFIYDSIKLKGNFVGHGILWAYAIYPYNDNNINNHKIHSYSTNAYYFIRLVQNMFRLIY